MKTLLLLALGLGAAFYGLKLANDAAAMASMGQGEAADGEGLGEVLATVNDYNPLAFATVGADQSEVSMALYSPNVLAALEALKWAEGTAKAADPYRVCYGYRHTIKSFADHPAVTGEWMGEKLDNLGPRYVGLKSTAAGAYQIIKPTWRGCKAALRLVDFSPEAQDAAAVYLLKECGALPLIEAGQFTAAVGKMGKLWASMPTATDGQPTRKFSDLAKVYQAAGGQVFA